MPLLFFFQSMPALAKILFFIALLAAASGGVSPPVALAMGILFGLSFAHPYSNQSRITSKFLLQGSVVALGFGMNLEEVLKAGRSGFLYTAVGIVFAIAAGLGIGKLLQVRGNCSYLITAGTAICGGSAIAAVGPILHADEEEMAVSLGTIFILNSIALLIFPGIGFALHLSQSQFGLWTALAIHDTSSVVGAAARWGTQALVIATTVKLARALWIVPLALVTAARMHSRAESSRGLPNIQFPWFILFFCLAATVNTYIPAWHRVTSAMFYGGKLGLTVTLFLIGTGISRATLREVGWRPMLQGVALWVVVAAASLYFIRAGFIAF
jgi:uncharacterized integral membrane protein (TIGR00698 family)